MHHGAGGEDPLDDGVGDLGDVPLLQQGTFLGGVSGDRLLFLEQQRDSLERAEPRARLGEAFLRGAGRIVGHVEHLLGQGVDARFHGRGAGHDRVEQLDGREFLGVKKFACLGGREVV